MSSRLHRLPLHKLPLWLRRKFVNSTTQRLSFEDWKAKVLSSLEEQLSPELYTYLLLCNKLRITEEVVPNKHATSEPATPVDYRFFVTISKDEYSLTLSYVQPLQDISTCGVTLLNTGLVTSSYQALINKTPVPKVLPPKKIKTLKRKFPSAKVNPWDIRFSHQSDINTSVLHFSRALQELADTLDLPSV